MHYAIWDARIIILLILLRSALFVRSEYAFECCSLEMFSLENPGSFIFQVQ